MIQIKQQTEQQLITIPRPQALPPSGAWALVLRNGMTRKEYTFDGTPTEDGMILKLNISFDALPDKGQYSYTLTRGDKAVSAGLAQVGQAAMRPTRTTYNETTETIQYNG